MELDPTSLDAQNNMEIKKTYIHANSQVLAMHDGDTEAPLYFSLHDRLGSLRQIIDSTGDLKAYFTYDPLGQILVGEFGLSIANPFMFTGQYYDMETGQYDHRARLYNPYIGRFTTEDPAEGKFENPLTLHKYLYCGNDPINKFDPLGLYAMYFGYAVGGIGGLGPFGVGATYMYGIAFDDNGNVAPIQTVSFGAGIATKVAGPVLGLAFANANTIYDLKGYGKSVGSSFGALGFTGFWGDNNGAAGYEVSGNVFGYGPGAQFMRTYTWLGNGLPDPIEDWADTTGMNARLQVRQWQQQSRRMLGDLQALTTKVQGWARDPEAFFDDTIWHVSSQGEAYGVYVTYGLLNMVENAEE